MPVDGYIFDEPIENPLDFDALDAKADEWGDALYAWMVNHPHFKQGSLFDGTDQDVFNHARDVDGETVWGIHLYITGLTSALLSLLLSMRSDLFEWTFYHYDRDTDEYVAQPGFMIVTDQ